MKKKFSQRCFSLLLSMTALGMPLHATNLKAFAVSTPGFMIVAGSDGALWYTHSADSNDGVSRISVSGKQEVVDVPGSLNRPWGVALSNNGDLWFTDANAPVIRRLSKDRIWTEFPVPTRTLGITQGSDGNMWFGTDRQIGRLAPSGAVKMFRIPSDISLPGPMTVGPDGNIWFTDQMNAIGRVDSSGRITLFSLQDASWPFSITAGPDNNLWFTELVGNKIGRISTDGKITEFELPHPQSVPDQIVQGPDGNLWFTEHKDRIGRITTEGVITELEIPASYGDASGLAFGPDGNLWIVFLYPANNEPKVVRMTLGGTPVNGPCVASDTVLCIDDTPGDRRFQVEVEYETAQAGGLAGKGRAIPLSSLGVARGGLFWFFSEENPELVVKILNGCTSNQKYWVFISGGTNVGMIITVSDTVTGEVHTYYNRENTPFAPIQDTSALSCGS